MKRNKVFRHFEKKMHRNQKKLHLSLAGVRAIGYIIATPDGA
jgi:hypothetical protein